MAKSKKAPPVAEKLAKPHSEVEMVDLSAVKPYWRNPRKNDAAVDFLVNAITRYGFQVPIILDSTNTIVAGHSRYRAALKLSLPQVPCIRVNLTPDRVRQFRIADNKTSELSKWDFEKLTSELMDITDLKSVAETFGAEGWVKLVNAVFDSSATDEDTVKPATPAPSSVPVPAAPVVVPPSQQFSVTCPHCGQHQVFIEGVDL